MPDIHKCFFCGNPEPFVQYFPGLCLHCGDKWQVSLNASFDTRMKLLELYVKCLLEIERLTAADQPLSVAALPQPLE